MISHSDFRHPRYAPISGHLQGSLSCFLAHVPSWRLLGRILPFLSVGELVLLLVHPCSFSRNLSDKRRAILYDYGICLLLHHDHRRAELMKSAMCLFFLIYYYLGQIRLIGHPHPPFFSFLTATYSNSIPLVSPSICSIIIL